MKSCIIKIVMLLTFIIALPLTSNASEKIRFGVPPWPGITVKTIVVAKIINAMGYESEMLEVGPPIIYKSMALNDMDIFLAGWTPQQNPMLDPLVKEGKVVKVRTNLSDALIGVCVSKDAWEGGVKSITDLRKHPDKFSKTIYDIEAGSGMHTAMEGIIRDNVAGLGKWEHLGTTTPVMLAEVKNRIKNDKWVVFGCWKPHWMAVQMDIRFLEGTPGTENLITKSDVFTVTRSNFAKEYPQIQILLDNFVVSAKTQSEWINDYSYKNEKADSVATKWITNNISEISSWLKGAKTIDGKSAIDAVKAKFAK